ncbi:MAG: hypothetical protein KIT25_13795 [Enhydrobacter sp.]|nr:MAG: hypothetical protein KIT25_13795 [Enhydrobacter sp.]
MARHLPTDKLRSALVFHHEDVPLPGLDHVKTLLNILGPKGQPLAIRRNDPAYTADQLAKGLEDSHGDVLVDITSFTHEALLILMRVLKERLGQHQKAYVAYNPAKSYGDVASGETPWLSRGLKAIRSVLGYPGNVVPGRPLHLLVMAGYEPDRAARIIDAYQPRVLSLGNGAEDSSVDERMHELNKFFVGGLKASQPSFQEFTFSCLNPELACNALVDAISKQKRHNVVVAPMNTKLSTIGAALAALRDPTIQLCYSVPEYYNVSNYSLPSDRCFLEELAFERSVADKSGFG